MQEAEDKGKSDLRLWKLLLTQNRECDGERPSCGQCRKGKRECGGYQRDRYFKNLSALDHDTLLARAQPLAPLTEPSAIIYSTPIPIDSHKPVNKDQDLVSPRSDLQQLQEEAQESSNLSELFHYFVSHYFPRNDWVQSLVPLQGTNPSLDLAMSALSMVRLGRLNHDESLRRKGLANYGKALEGMRDILESGEMWCEEQTLASAMVFLIFEVIPLPCATGVYGLNRILTDEKRCLKLHGRIFTGG